MDAYYAVCHTGLVVVTEKSYFDETGALDEDTENYVKILDAMYGLGCRELTECCFELPPRMDVDAIVAGMAREGIRMVHNMAVREF